MWQAWINFILGIVVLVMAYTTTSATWFTVVALLIIIFSLWDALAPRKG